MTIKHPITGERTGYFDENATALKVGDTVELFGQNGTVTFDGIIFQNGVPWEAIKDKVWQLCKTHASQHLRHDTCAVRALASLR